MHAMAISSDDLLARLQSLGIDAKTSTHPPLMTVEDAKRLRGDLPGGHVKNLFLRDRRERFWLLTTLEDTRVDLKRMAQRLDAGRFSFANGDQLKALLGILPGAVSPLAVINDTERQVAMVLDEALLAHDPLNVHPLVNDRTTTIPTADLLRFLESCGHKPRLMRFDEA
jgi:Ala-tRNA(Pro) deacylase